jgi:transcriptional regulator with XRE-family HTH domain
MKSIVDIRKKTDISQRRLASLAKISYKTLQLIESGNHDTKVSTLKKIAEALGYQAQSIDGKIAEVFKFPPCSARNISENIAIDGALSWKLWLFNFVDAFRENKSLQYISSPIIEELPDRIKALITATVETLCEETNTKMPWWCQGIPPLKQPWFVAEVESLKAAAIVESPVHFRKRNIFVLSNFLDRR